MTFIGTSFGHASVQSREDLRALCRAQPLDAGLFEALK